MSHLLSSEHGISPQGVLRQTQMSRIPRPVALTPLLKQDPVKLLQLQIMTNRLRDQNGMTGKVINDYQILQKIGNGAFGVIYKARKLSDNTVCVIKELEVSDFESGQSVSGRSYQQEAVIMDNIPQHQYVVSFIDTFTHASKFCIVMEYCEKGDLSDYMRRVTANMEIPEWKVWRFIIQLLLALNHLHKHNIVHSDLKPSNIFLAGKDCNVKLGDFGTSQLLTKNYFFVHECVGTLFYLSPEVCRNDPFNTKTDIWSLGCIIYELCTNRKPFDGLSDENLKSKIINIQHPQLPEEKFSQELNFVYNQCLIKDMDKRPTALQILQLPMIQQWADQLKIPLGVPTLRTSTAILMERPQSVSEEFDKASKVVLLNKRILKPEVYTQREADPGRQSQMRSELKSPMQFTTRQELNPLVKSPIYGKKHSLAGVAAPPVVASSHQIDHAIAARNNYMGATILINTLICIFWLLQIK